MQRLMTVALPLLALTSLTYSQTFEVASFKVRPPANPGESVPTTVEPTPGNLVMRNVGMGQLIMWAFKVGRAQVSNPEVAMAVTDRFDIIAKAAGPAKSDELRVMLQNLLAERLKLKTHRETKEISTYVLVEAKGGHRMKVSEAADGRGVLPVQQPGKMALTGQSATLDQLCTFLSGPLRTPVLDMTGLKERFDFEFDITSFNVNAAPAPGEPPVDPVSVLQTALPKQLGLKLESRQMPVEMLVIDHVEPKPVEN
jgi:uncharacterized protein (TIGR03435 family)